MRALLRCLCSCYFCWSSVSQASFFLVVLVLPLSFPPQRGLFLPFALPLGSKNRRTMPRTNRTPPSAQLPSQHEFETMGFAIMRREKSKAGEKTRNRRFISFFGAEPVFIAITWRKLYDSGWLEYAGVRPNPKHVLWAFMWLKSYFNEEVGSSLAGDNVDEKTYRDWCWFYIKGIASLDTEVVSRCCCGRSAAVVIVEALLLSSSLPKKQS